MKISLEWLSEYLPSPLAADQAADVLTHGGLPVEHIDRVCDDSVIDVEVTSNRGDCLSHLGVARELGALLGREARLPQPGVSESSMPASSATSVRIDALDLCPHYTARVIRNLRIGPSPAWMVRRLEAVGLRAINNVVDVTNYVMFEMGQPLHAFDFDRLAEHRIIVRRAAGGEKITSIDGRERALAEGMLVIADANRPVALAGVMGGIDSEVSPSTTSVLLESARFDPLSVRRTARGLAMMSDSSYRFERGIDPTLPERASLRAAQLILQTAGGELLSGLVACGASGYTPRKLSLRMSRLRQLLGIELPVEKVMDALRRLQFSPAVDGDRVDVQVPSWRLDVNIEADLIEEVARLVGYGQIPVREEISIRLTPPSADASTLTTIRDLLAGAGYYEAITVTFISDSLRDSFTPPEAAALPRALAVTRPADAHLRPTLIGGLLEAVRHNETVGNLGARLFETGSTFWTDSAGKIVERRRLTVVGSDDMHEVRGVVEALLGKLNPGRAITIVPDSRPGFASGACGRIEWGGDIAGYVGRVDRAVAEKLALRELPCAAELELSLLLEHALHVRQLQPLPRFPAVRRDLSLVLGESVRYEAVDRIIRDLKLPDLENLEYVTTYRGKPLERGTKSVTVTLVFRSQNATLTSEQVEASVQRAIEATRQGLSATLRT